MDYADVLAQLISIDTSVSPELDPSRNYLKTIEYLEPLFAETGFETQRAAIPSEHAKEEPAGSTSWLTAATPAGPG